MASSRIKTCFISAALDSNLDVIRDVLAQHDVRVVGIGDVNLGEPILSSTRDAIESSDLVIGVLSRSRSARHVLFELGLAVGRNKQIVIFAPVREDLIPFDLRQFLIVRTTMTNKQAISFALTQVLGAPERSATPVAEIPGPSSALGDAADDFIAEYEEILDKNSKYGNGRQLERLVHRAISMSGADVVSEASFDDSQVDLAVWSDALQLSVGNPLLVEIKSDLRSHDNIRKATNQLAHATSNTSSPWGLLIYGEGPVEADINWKASPTVLIISVRELFEMMRTTSFVDIVRSLRNQRAHGVP